MFLRTAVISIVVFLVFLLVVLAESEKEIRLREIVFFVSAGLAAMLLLGVLTKKRR